MIEVFADVVCPFTHVGLRHLVARRKELGASHLSLHVRAWPLELVNGSPLEAEFVAEEIDALREQVAGDLFTRFDKTRFPSTSIPALVLAAAAYRQGIDVGERVSLALRQHLFEEGHNIADAQVLTAIADIYRVIVTDADHDSVTADWEEGKRRGVLGSPHFFAGDVGVFCPALDIKRVDGHLRIAANPGALNEFLERGLAG